MTYIIVFLGAGIGGAMRHAVNQLALRYTNGEFPYGTLAINILGSLVMGLIAGYFALRSNAPQLWRLFLTTGILGGFTTFSAFSLDAVLLFERGRLIEAASYVGVSVGAAILALCAGLAIARL